jgi:hypothetical protein
MMPESVVPDKDKEASSPEPAGEVKMSPEGRDSQKKTLDLGRAVDQLGHWVAFAFVAIYHPKLFDFWWLLDYFLTALVIAWLSAFQYVLLCWLMEKAGK